MKVRVFQVPNCSTQNKFRFYKLPSEILEQNSGSGYFRFRFGYSEFGFRVMVFLPSPTLRGPQATKRTKLEAL
jgi:hypothetical protein